MKKKKKIGIMIGCVVASIVAIAGITYQLDYNHRIVITQFAPQTSRQTMGYMLKTKQDKIIMIDGGTIEDSEHVKEILQKNGGVVESWYLTHAHDDHFGVLLDILRDDNAGIVINNIYLNLNPEQWYQENDADRYNYYWINELFDVLEKPEIQDKIHVVQPKEEIVVDNLKVKILKVASPEIIENAGNNQSVVIKVSNRDKSILFLGDLSEQAEEEFIRNNLEEMDCDVVQMAHHGQAGVSEKVYQLIRPEICLWPTPSWLYDNDKGTGYSTAEYKTIETRQWMNNLGVKHNYVAKDGDLTIEIY